VRSDLKLTPGKLAAQVAHAAVEAVLRSDEEKVKSGRREGMMKIVLKVKDEKELHGYNQQAKDVGLITALITDAGHTVVEPGTVTCVAIGPDKAGVIDTVTGELQPL
ncbi:aminoacyl-tRNA hydrolase, partial [Candidatus Woesearchaeota archaeon]|nr:aminoacyl-tRNA hydrolase [Candidatus Woesearchaeota archaeon]